MYVRLRRRRRNGPNRHAPTHAPCLPPTSTRAHTRSPLKPTAPHTPLENTQGIRQPLGAGARPSHQTPATIPSPAPAAARRASALLLLVATMVVALSSLARLPVASAFTPIYRRAAAAALTTVPLASSLPLHVRVPVGFRGLCVSTWDDSNGTPCDAMRVHAHICPARPAPTTDAPTHPHNTIHHTPHPPHTNRSPPPPSLPRP